MDGNSDARGTSGHSSIEIRVLGYCDQSEDSIKRIFHSGRKHMLGNLGGEYTLICSSPDEVVIVTSMIGALHYYYYYNGTRFEHGEDVIEITRRLGIDWEWDWESVGDICEQENLTENRTLHKYIKRVPPGTILSFGDKLLLHTTNFLDSITESSSDPIDALNVFNNETKRWITRDPYLSLSGGFDSRVILSSMLSQQIYPTVVTLGDDQSSDVRVAREISESYGLQHIRVVLDFRDLLENGERIARITNGTKPACHWHTYLYPKKAEIPRDESFFVGTLGEFARSYYFDKGILSLLLNDSGPGAQEKFWKLKLNRHRTFADEEQVYLSGDLLRQVNRQGLETRAKRNARLSRGTLLSGGTRYYLEQRVPNFYANGIRMYNDSGQWRSPFHNTEWLQLIWGLGEQWKLGSNWHRLAIQRNFSSLLDFPEEKGLNKKKMLRKAPPFYWLPVMQRMKYKSYDLSNKWYAVDEIQSFILDNHRLYSDMVSKNGAETILNEHKGGIDRSRAISFILTMLFFGRCLEAGG